MKHTYRSPADVLSQMTLAEKIGQLNQAPREHDIDPESIRNGRVGSVILSTSAYAGNEKQERVRAQRMNTLQKWATEESRLGVPLLIARDVIHGHRTVAPIPLGQAASWSPSDVQRGAEIAALEACADGIRWVFTPMMDIARDARWGRIAESFGEDPFLSTQMAVASVKGYQGDNIGAYGRVAACAKHFVGYGAAEGGRDYNTTEITPNTLRNIYLPPFKAAVEAGVATIMSAFHEVGGLPITANRRLLTEILKREWGFLGPVISDWGAVAELILHGIAADPKDAGRQAFLAGVDIDMASDAYDQWLEILVTEGIVSLEAIDEAATRVLELKWNLGLFENPYTDTEMASQVQFTSEHQRDVLALAQKSLVLLRNQNNLLPLPKKIQRMGVFGPLVEAKREMLGTWCLDGEEEDVTTVLQGIQDTFEVEWLKSTALTDEAISLARFCDVVVAVVGEQQHRSGEANSTTTLDLPPGQTEFLVALQRMGTPIVLIVMAGRPIALPPSLSGIDAIIHAWHPGSLGGRAIADVLCGDVNPSGKMPITTPRSVGQVPIYYNCKATGRPLDPYAKGVTRYVDELDSPLYPFGFGLSYSEYEYSGISVKPLDGGFRVTCTVTNRSEYDGEEIVQLYLRDLVASSTRPVKELKGFERIAILAGESAEVDFTLSREDLGFYGPDEKWVTEPGMFQFWIGPNARDGLMIEATLA